MSHKLNRSKINKFLVGTVTVLTVIVFAFSFLSSGVPVSAQHGISATPQYQYNRTVYKYQWMNDTSVAGPMPISNGTMSCFIPSQEVVLFGGQTMLNLSFNKSGKKTFQVVKAYSNQTWVYQSGQWSRLTSQSSIPQMAGSVTSYYPRGESIVLFGGENNGTLFNYTWIFTGLTWTPLKGLTLAPSARAFSSMAYSPIIKGIVLFGGKTSSGYSNSTWLFKDNSWSKLTTKGTVPPAMEGTAMSELPNGNLLLYGGFNGSYSNSTYILNTTSLTWSKVKSTENPPALAFSSLNYFSFNNFTLLYGGVTSNGNPSNVTYIFNSANQWQMLNIKAPSAKYGQSLSVYGANNTVVLFGGAFNNSYYGFTNDTYQFQNNSYDWVIFNESGLPSGLKWGVQLGNSYNNTTGNSVGFLVMTGTYDYNVTAPAGYQTSSPSGNVTMYFSELKESVTFSKIPGLLYYSYGAIAGIIIVVLALIGAEAYRKIIK
ncbi:kelch repeat-containing protein [Cuniculiplasma sp. SKW4]|uniref:Kelch repeat-containing protein n=1 Tax=Cuniculiplasma sp. SKW4 TaxID=3400171 RepID=UPI003FD35243